MKFNYQSHSLKSGVYKITNIHTGRIYIGQAKSFKKRWYQHSVSLRSNKHQNKFLQNDFNKCKEELGHDDFLVFEVIEVIEGSTKEQRNTREEWWISQHYDNQSCCYNLRQKVEGKERSCRSNTPEETKKKQSESMKKRWEDPEWKTSQVEKLKLSAQNEEYKKKISASTKRLWSSEEFKASQKEKLKIAAANRPTEKEQIRIEKFKTTIRATREKIKFYGILISPDGSEHEVWNLRRFASEHGLEQMHSNLGRVLNGTAESCKGWKSKNPKPSKQPNPRKKYLHIIQSPEGKVYYIDFLRQFIKENPHLGLKYTGLFGLVSGKIDSYKGWKCHFK